MNRVLTLEKWRPRMIALAHTIKRWSSCVMGKQHGCVLAIDGKYVVATGFNGVHRMDLCKPNCQAREGQDDSKDGCEIAPEHCTAIHAEVNAVINAARVGANLSRCWAYMTKQPCPPCRSILINAGIQVVIWEEAFRGAERPEKDGVELF